MAEEVGCQNRCEFCASRSSLRHPGLAHVFNDPLASLQENWIVTLRGVPIAPQSEIRIEGKPGFDFALRFVESAKLHQNSGTIG